MGALISPHPADHHTRARTPENEAPSPCSSPSPRYSFATSYFVLRTSYFHSPARCVHPHCFTTSPIAHASPCRYRLFHPACHFSALLLRTSYFHSPARCVHPHCFTTSPIARASPCRFRLSHPACHFSALLLRTSYFVPRTSPCFLLVTDPRKQWRCRRA